MTRQPADPESSPIALMAVAIEEHFAEAEPHFCQGACTEDLLRRMNERELYIVTEATLSRLHKPCVSEILWYREALTSIMNNSTLLKPEAVAQLALDRSQEKTG